MTDITNLKATTDDSKPTIVRAIHFDPWPFEDEEIILLDDALYIDPVGALISSFDNGGNVALTAGDDDILVVLSDGTIAATSVSGIREYE